MKVVGLGFVDRTVVQPVLGDSIEFVEHPSAKDLSFAQGAIVRGAFSVTKELLESMPNLRVIARTGVGTELVDLKECNQRGIPVVITPGSNTNAVAEGAIGMALALSKKFLELTKLVASGDWERRSEFAVGDLEQSTLGLIGFGRIGRRVATLAEAFGMQIRAFDPDAEIPLSFRVDSLQALISQADFISLHVPLTAENRNLIGESLLNLVKPGAILVNCSRGGLVDLDAALAALDDGRLGGLGLDTYEPEPPPHHQIFEHPRVILTPHVMGLTVRSTYATYQEAARGVRDVLEGRAPKAVAK